MKHITESYKVFLHSVADRLRLTKYPLLRDLIAELAATLIYVAFGTGVAAQTQLNKPSFGTSIDISFGYAAGWALGLFVAGSRSPGMCNPCVAFANALIGRLDFLTMLLFWLAELIGSILGSLFVMAVYWEKIMDYKNTYDNGTLLMNSTGTIFASTVNTTIGSLCAGQVITTMLKLAAIMAILDKNNWNFPYFYVIIYATVVQFLTFNDFTVQTTSAGNPAYDLGGRTALSMTGWGSSPFTYANHAFWVFLVMPLVGTICGVLLYELVVGVHLPGAGEDEGPSKIENGDESDVYKK
ncbi:Aquaporin-9 [Echinococcus granulosus]|uniref:Aquaporin 9 AQP 9 Small solute channel 1 n=1 Tax=Echinococcus granulosus TaxID=6210 RepID=U6JHB5_ECHGR|nr:Aquaporin-9 [Echinococcus granulosus]EUB58272.1 Aquaporin-9 [Echinococcus granulosus]CDS21164.1 Aquaporin 9 AQP 9 Small solute channel 1 [Echinococcus granulosus]